MGRFGEALELVDDGLARSPSEAGTAIGQAARGEALCGLNRPEEALRCFEQAIQAHSIVGRLNVADAMTRLPVVNLLNDAAVLLLEVENSLKDDTFRAEIYTIRGKIFRRLGQFPEARDWFHRALMVDPSYGDAALQMRALSEDADSHV